MFGDVNEVRLLGNITNDPDLRFTPNGSAVLSFGLATNRRYKKGDEWVDDTTFHNIVIWGNQAQSLSQRVKKGTRIYIAGRLQVRTWDGNDGKKNYKTEVVADSVVLIARFNEGPANELPPVGAPAASSSAPSAPKRQQKMEEEAPDDLGITDSIDPDDLPF